MWSAAISFKKICILQSDLTPVSVEAFADKLHYKCVWAARSLDCQLVIRKNFSLLHKKLVLSLNISLVDMRKSAVPFIDKFLDGKPFFRKIPKSTQTRSKNNILLEG